MDGAGTNGTKNRIMDIKNKFRRNYKSMKEK